MSTTQHPYVIVVAVDYADGGHLAFQRALELAAEQPRAEVHVINVMPGSKSGYPDAASGTWAGSPPSVEQAAEQLRGYVAERAALFRAAHAGQSLPFLDTIRAHQRLEIPSEEIAQLAADVDADLVVVGTHGRRGLSRLMIGSVAEATVRLAPCPVLVVRPKAVPPPVPAIQPPCPRCVEARRASGGQQFWCDEHSRHHGQRHTYHQADRVGSDTNMPLMVRS
jgi:nucleotide-binding universal stress UspA family protein